MIARNSDYQPPSDHSVHKFAEQVCGRLAVQRNDTAIADQRVVSGFADLLKLLFRLEAKILNASQET